MSFAANFRTAFVISVSFSEIQTLKSCASFEVVKIF